MAYADLQVKHIAALVAQYLGSTACRRVLRYPPLLGPPQDGYPALTVYRRSTAIRGTAQIRLHEATLSLGYSLGLVPQSRLEDAWGSLSAVVAVVDEALHRRSHASYESGKTLEVLAGIVSVELVSVEYSAALAEGREVGAWPAWEAQVRCVHSTSYSPADLEALTDLVASYPEIQRSPDSDHPGLEVQRVYTVPSGP